MARQRMEKPKKPPQIMPWQVPPFPERGDESDSTTYEAIGRALSAWEAFELDLSRIFGALVGANDGLLAAMRAYGSVLTFRGRNDMVKAAAGVFFLLQPNEDLQKDLKRLLDLSIDYSPRRNEIAHGIVLAYSAFFVGKDEGYCLGPTAYATNKQELQSLSEGYIIGHRPRYCYASPQINAFRDRFYDDLMEPARKVMVSLFRHRKLARARKASS